ncbi:MAG: phosphonoacetaldehyde hydrolase [Mariniphaga sp.]
MNKLENIRAVIFDWAGTLIDYGCIAPTQVFIEVFQRRGIEVTVDEARGPMGLAKKDHVRALVSLDSVQKQWKAIFNRLPDEQDVNTIYSELEPALASIVKLHSEPIPGAVELIDQLKSQGIKVGTTTGYVAEMMNNVLPLSIAKGLNPDSVVNSSEVAVGRPAPFMIFRNCENMGVFPLSSMVKIGDTVADIHEGRNAGMWTIGLTKSGNEVGLTLEETQRADPEWLAGKIAIAEQKLTDAGADFVSEGPWDCWPILEEIDRRIALKSSKP